MSENTEAQSTDERPATPVFNVVGGGVARIVRADADNVMLETGAPSPPGSTLRLLVLNREVGVKVRGCRRIEGSMQGRLEGAMDSAGSALFRIEGRWVSLSREQREVVTTKSV
ncbi:MAG TPA: hypothetical protein VFQ61_03935 [Polyangiaceae bacterium]|nr:hypothetical protein [Polyangiaceae bacterium]